MLCKIELDAYMFYSTIVSQPEFTRKVQEMQKGGRTHTDEHFIPLVNISREPVAPSTDDYTTTLYFTTDQYTYFVHVDKQDLVLKKFKMGDTSPSANPRNNKQFYDKFYPSCASCTPDD